MQTQLIRFSVLNGKKANSTKFGLKPEQQVLGEPIATLFNMSITQAGFPGVLKRAEISLV